MMKKQLFSLILILLSIVSFSQNNSTSLVEKGIRLYKEGRYHEALSYYDIALNKNSGDNFALAEKSLALNALGRHKEVVKIGKKNFRSNWENPEIIRVFLAWGNSLEQLGEPAKAIDVYNEGLSKFPTSTSLLLSRGIASTVMGNFPKALFDFETIVQIDPYSGAAHNYIARLNYHEHPVQAILALSRFVLIEYEGSRAEEGLELLKKALQGNASLLNGDSSKVNVSISSNLAKRFRDKNSTDENNFTEIEIQLSLLGSLNFTEEYKNNDQYKKMEMKIDHLVGQFMKHREEKTGFYWEYYVPYFIGLKKNGFLQIFTRLLFMPEKDPENMTWLANHEAELDAFYEWDKHFIWNSFGKGID